MTNRESSMSETAAALLILPFLAALVVVLECSRLGCKSVMRRWSVSRSATELESPEFSSTAD